MSSIVETVFDVPAEHQGNVFGQFDSHIKKIEQTLKVSVVARDGEVKLLGRQGIRSRLPAFWGSFWSFPAEEM